MITFKRNSWHYKFNSWLEKQSSGPWLDATDCKSICPYFWCTLWNITWTLLFILVFFFIATLAGATSLSMETISALDFSWLWLAGVGVVTSIFGIFLLVAVGTYLIFDLTKNVLSKIFSQKGDATQEDKEPSVVVEWVKAKKAKICPMIEFKE